MKQESFLRYLLFGNEEQLHEKYLQSSLLFVVFEFRATLLALYIIKRRLGKLYTRPTSSEKHGNFSDMQTDK